MEMHKDIQEAARPVRDPAGREVRVISDGPAIEIADAFRSDLHEVYRQALSAGIYPCRYIRNRDTLSPEEQLKLAESRVTVVGAGGLGGQVIMLLARVGLGHLVVVDHDVFDETNLNRQALCFMDSLGRPKAEAAATEVARVNPGVRVTPHRIRIDDSSAPGLLMGSAVAIDALDSISDRFCLERAAKREGIPLVHGALAGFEGRIMSVFPDDPGLIQLYGEEGTYENDTPRPEAVLGVPTFTPALIGALQAMEAVKIILKRGTIFRQTMAHMDLEGGEFYPFSL